MPDALPPYHPVGVARALAASTDSAIKPEATLFKYEFALTDRVALVTGANGGIGLDISMALIEAGARVVFCVDLAPAPSATFAAVQNYLARIGGLGRLEYVCQDVTDQKAMWTLAGTIGDAEGRLDICVANAGIVAGLFPSLTHPQPEFDKTIDVNLKGTLFAAQACGQQMERFGTGGSIIFIASVAASVAIEPAFCTVAYTASKAGQVQLARSMACELAPKRIRVNSISPAWIKTSLTALLDDNPTLHAAAVNGNPMGRIARPDELRGAAVWLASDAASFVTGSDIHVCGGHTAW
ncbi:sorbose reductase sou1 [Epithele typhae]|uniref:sorbose reductase sou1 n=1 Tax=Epithele typhae TaxID=378194 RepID=UPI0020076B04|nr:sorbose reductase sou1 [Epithele typhae]KAH9930416.1 sorbose reductase sou1 [Epithele typhae]